jgi:hypothetical protein
VRDYGQMASQTILLNAFGIYLDDGTSNIMVSGNIIAANTSTLSGYGAGQMLAPFMIHDGSNNTFTDNIIDLNNNNPIMWYQSTGTGNSFYGNIIIGGFTGSGGGFQGEGTFSANLSVYNNLYYNYAGGTMLTGNDDVGSAGDPVSGGSDSSPITNTNPDFGATNWYYTLAQSSPVYSAPLDFTPIVGGWGPPGYTIPETGTQPSYLSATS